MAFEEIAQLQHVRHQSCAYRPALGDSMILCRLFVCLYYLDHLHICEQVHL